MMFPSNRVRVLVSTQPIDFRKGHDGLAALVSSVLRKDPFTGTVFVFRSRRADRLKLLYWDGTGLVMAYKRLEDATFTWPAIKDGMMALNHAQFEALFAGLDWRKRQGAGDPPAGCGRMNHLIDFACFYGGFDRNHPCRNPQSTFPPSRLRSALWFG
jgi:transposase